MLLHYFAYINMTRDINFYRLYMTLRDLYCLRMLYFDNGVPLQNIAPI